MVGGYFAAKIWLVAIALSPNQQRPDVLRRRTAWFDGQLDFRPEQLIFIVDTAASMKVTRLRDRAPCDDRCQAAVRRVSQTLKNDSAKSRTTVSLSPGQLAGVGSQMPCCVHLVPVKRGCFMLSQPVARQQDAMGVVDDLVENGVSDGGVGDQIMPFGHSEPPRVCRRPFRLSYAAIAGSSSIA